MNAKLSASQVFPQLPITSLQTADEITTHDIADGRTTVIDFWTTKCVKCPAALDHLNELATPNSDVKFVSICCDSLDGAREIIERDDDLRWSSMQHFFMAQEHKETAKKILGFQQVPFYVVLNQEGQLLDKGNKVDFAQYLSDKENTAQEPSSTNQMDDFVIDDLDF